MEDLIISQLESLHDVVGDFGYSIEDGLRFTIVLDLPVYDNDVSYILSTFCDFSCKFNVSEGQLVLSFVYLG